MSNSRSVLSDYMDLVHRFESEFLMDIIGRSYLLKLEGCSIVQTGIEIEVFDERTDKTFCKLIPADDFYDWHFKTAARQYSSK